MTKEDYTLLMWKKLEYKDIYFEDLEFEEVQEIEKVIDVAFSLYQPKESISIGIKSDINIDYRPAKDILKENKAKESISVEDSPQNTDWDTGETNETFGNQPKAKVVSDELFTDIHYEVVQKWFSDTMLKKTDKCLKEWLTVKRTTN